MDTLYKQKSGTRKAPGEKTFMCVEEFIALLTEANLISDVFTEREASISFNSAMQTQVEEIEKERHLKMEFIEFIEAIARAAEIISKPPYGLKVNIDIYIYIYIG